MKITYVVYRDNGSIAEFGNKKTCQDFYNSWLEDSYMYSNICYIDKLKNCPDEVKKRIKKIAG